MCICITESHTHTKFYFLKFGNVYLFASFSKCLMGCLITMYETQIFKYTYVGYD